jgi:hypothetical protein
MSIHPQLARVAGVPAPPGSAWCLVRYYFVPCKDQINGDGQPDMETVALMPCDGELGAPQASVAGVPRGATGTTLVKTPMRACENCQPSGNLAAGSRIRVLQDPGNGRFLVSATTGNLPAANWWISSAAGIVQWDVAAGDTTTFATPGGIPIGATRNGGQEVWTGAQWVPAGSWTPGAAAPVAEPGVGVGTVRGGRVWNGRAWVPQVGATRNGGRQIWTGSAWADNPNYGGQGNAGRLAIGTTRNGGAEVWTGKFWELNPAFGALPPQMVITVGTTRNAGREVWDGKAWRRRWRRGDTRNNGAQIYNGTAWVTNAPARPVSTTVALNLSGLLAQQPAPQPAGLSAADLLALAAANSQGGDADQGDDDVGDLEDLLSAGDGDDDDGDGFPIGGDDGTPIDGFSTADQQGGGWSGHGGRQGDGRGGSQMNMQRGDGSQMNMQRAGGMTQGARSK